MGATTAVSRAESESGPPPPPATDPSSFGCMPASAGAPEGNRWSYENPKRHIRESRRAVPPVGVGSRESA
jgi:hypothetical protein